jgi:hypothetical protein
MAVATGPIEEAWLGIAGDALWVNVRFHQHRVPSGTLTLLVGDGCVQAALPGGVVWGEAAAAVGTTLTVQCPLKAVGGILGNVLEVALVFDDGTCAQHVPHTGVVALEVPSATERWQEAWG